MTGIAYVLLHLALLPAGGGVAEVGLEQKVAGHGAETRIDLALLAPADLIHRGLHVVVNPAPGHAAQRRQAVVVGIEQHLVGLQRIAAQHEGPAVAQLEMGHLQLHLAPAHTHPVFAPVELERFAWREHQRDIGTPAGPVGGFALALAPGAGKSRHPVVRTGIAQLDQVLVQLLEAAPAFTVAARLALQPGRQCLGEGVQLADPFARWVLGFHHVAVQVLANGMPGQAGPPGNLPNRQAVAAMPATDNTQ